MRNTLSAAIVLMILPTFAGAQGRPDLSGTWTLPADAPLAPNGKPAVAPGFGPSINISQDASSVTISRMIAGQTVHVRHPTDGSESRSRTPGRLCEGDSQSIWNAVWQGDRLVTTMVGSLPAGAAAPTRADVKASFHLRAPDAMVVEMSFRTAGTTEPRTSTTVYRRTGPAAPVPATAAIATPAKIGQLEWLAGTWIGTTAATTFEERWTPAAGGSMLSVSRTIRGGVMSAFEFLCIVERDGGLVYQAMPNGRQPATDFALTRIEANSVTFENPEHDFPKMIRYSLGPDGTLEAVISGSEKQKPVTFRFKKQGS
jgi:hypothetical protein